MKILKLNLELVEKNLLERHKDGRLKESLIPLTVASYHLNSVKARNQVDEVLELILKILGLKEAPDLDENSIPEAQMRAYVLCEGGLLGNFAAMQPNDFYLDDRTGFNRREQKQIYDAVEHLKNLMVKQKVKQEDLRQLPHFHNCGVF